MKIFALLLGTSLGFAVPALADPVDFSQPSPRQVAAAPPSGPATSLDRKLRMDAFVTPEYPLELQQRNTSGTVSVATGIGIDGVPVNSRVTSDPSPFDASVLRVMGQWIFQPPSCRAAEAAHYELRFNVAFTAEDGHYYVAVRDSLLYWLGTPDTVPTSAQSRAPKPVRQTFPAYPRDAIRKNIVRGYAFARVSVDGEGNVTDVAVPYSYPVASFGDAAESVLHSWRYPADGASHEYCLQVSYSLDEGASSDTTGVAGPPPR